MTDALTEPIESLSSWWKVAALGTMPAGFAVLILLTVKAYQNAPPIPDKFVDPAGAVVFAADDVIDGQQVFLKQPDGQWHNLGPWRLSRPRFFRAVPAHPCARPRRSYRARASQPRLP